MFKNYFTIAIRNLMKNKIFTAVNILFDGHFDHSRNIDKIQANILRQTFQPHLSHDMYADQERYVDKILVFIF